MKFEGISTLDYHGFDYAVLTTIALGGGLLFLRFKYFKDIPQNMSREQWEDWKKVEAWIVPDKFHIPLYWLVVICTWIAVFGLTLYNSEFVVLAPFVIAVPIVAWIAKHARKETRAERAERENEKALRESEWEARLGRNWMKWTTALWLWGIFAWTGMFLNFYFLFVYIGVIVFLATKTGGKGGKGIGASGGHGGGMKYRHPKSVGSGYFQSNFGHWDANRFDPVGDQRRLRGEGL